MKAANRVVSFSAKRGSPWSRDGKRAAGRARCHRRNSHASGRERNERHAGAARCCRTSKANLPVLISGTANSSPLDAVVAVANRLRSPNAGTVRVAGMPRRPRDNSLPSAARSSIGSSHRRACAWHGDGHRWSAARQSRRRSAPHRRTARGRRVLRQKLLRMPIGSRYHGLAQPEAIGERARGHLRFIQIGRDVDVAHRDVLEQRRLIDKLIAEDDMIRDAEVAGALNQAFAIGLALSRTRLGCVAPSTT